MRRVVLLILSIFTIIQCSAINSFVAEQLLELEYLIFTEKVDSCRIDILCDKAQLLANEFAYQDAIDQLNRISFDSLSNETKSKLNKLFSIYSFQQKNYESAIYYSLQIEPAQRETDTILQYIHLQSLSQCEKFIQCKEQMSIYLIQDSIIDALPDSVIYLEPMHFHKLSIVPGYRQLQLNCKKQAAHSFILCSGFAGLVVYNSLHIYPATAFVYGLVPLVKFYSGGRINASNLARKKNIENMRKTRLLFANTLDSALIVPSHISQ